MNETGSRCCIRNVITFAGAFIAWIIGSGFATGQEILQFFTSYGYYSYGVVLLNLLGFLFLGQVLLTTGYEHREEVNFNHFTFFCGKKAGRFYSWLIPVTLIMIMAVLISGAGATISEYYGMDPYLGSMIMAAMVLCAYLTGFEKMVRIVSTIGPVIIAFTLLVGLATVIKSFGNLSHISQYETVLGASRSAPNWLISSVLYISLNFLSGSTYFTALGMTARSRKEAKWGAIWGAVTMILAIAIMNTAILLHSKDAASLAIPTLYLAKHISNALGAVFSVVLVLGMFSSCSTMMWTVCSRFTSFTAGRNRMAAAAVTVFTFLLGMLPFSRLINVFYPFVGYMGLIYIGCVACKGLLSTGMKTFLKYELSGWKAWEITWLAAACTVITALSVHWGDDSLGITMALTGVVCVILTGKGKMSCYLFGLVNTVLYAWIAFGARYYGEVMLNACYYVPMQFVGWFMWKKHMDGGKKEVEKTRLTAKGQILLLVLSAVSIYGYGMVLKQLGGNLPFIDSMSTCLSVLAMLLSVRRLMEQWIVWIVVDVVTVFMWFADYQKGGTDIATLLMWCIYLLNAIFMFVKWFRESGGHADEV